MLRDIMLDESFLLFNEQPESGFSDSGHSFPSATRQCHSFYTHPVRNNPPTIITRRKFVRLNSVLLGFALALVFASMSIARDPVKAGFEAF